MEEKEGGVWSHFDILLHSKFVVHQTRSAVIALYFFPLLLASRHNPLLVLSFVHRPTGRMLLVPSSPTHPKPSFKQLMQLQTGALYKFASSLLFVVVLVIECKLTGNTEKESGTFTASSLFVSLFLSTWLNWLMTMLRRRSLFFFPATSEPYKWRWRDGMKPNERLRWSNLNNWVSNCGPVILRI